MEMDIKQIINTLWRWKLLIGGILLVTIIGLIGFYLTAEDSYTAEIELQVTAPQNEDISLFGSVRSAGEREAITVARNNFSVVIESDIIQEQTVNELNLSEKEGEYDIEIRSSTDTDFMTIDFISHSPELAATIANTHIQKSIDRLGTLRALPSQQKLEELEGELADAEDSLRDAETALANFQDENNLSSSLQTEIDTYEQRLQRLILSRSDLLISEPFSDNNEVEPIDEVIRARQEELDPLLELRHEHNRYQLALANAQQQLEVAIGSNPQLTLAQEPLQSLQAQVTVAENNLNLFLADNDMISVESQIDQIYRLIEELRLERDRRLIAPSEDLQTARVLTIDTLIEETQERVIHLTSLEPEYNFLSIQLSRATQDYDFILQKYNEAEIVAESTTSADFIQIITLATPPEEPSSNVLFLVVFGFVGSLGLGIFMAFLLEYFSNYASNENEAEQKSANRHRDNNEENEEYQYPIRLHNQTSQGD